MLIEPTDSDIEANGVTFPEFNLNSDMAHPNMQVGLVFPNVQLYRKALRKHSVKNGFQLLFEKNESNRVTAKCKNLCGWRIYASFLGKSTSFQIKSIKGEPHRCHRDFRNRSANSTYLADRFLQNFVDDPHMTLNSFKKLVRREVNIYAHRQKLYRAKIKAIEAIQGNVKEQYNKLRYYCKQILKENPGSTAVVKVEGPPIYKNPTFQRIFILYEAQKRGFLLGCRPIIGLDACFLKGPYGGQLMAAIGRDGNNQMFH
ncbi:hypothetical protein DH2020_014634 [Rehmannia glutinosa]|uniref:Transposase MuDR plant domain-containing protein n=1 Tax=Rehmannia glutinosa TaxID=99300 RepID=A0ABR0X0G9_REHGL